MKEREHSARRKREEIERKREDQERKRLENENDRNKGGSRGRTGRQGKACTAERVDLQFPDHKIEHSEKVEQLLRRRATAGEEARQRAEAAATLRRIILREVSCQVGSC